MTDDLDDLWHVSPPLLESTCSNFNWLDLICTHAAVHVSWRDKWEWNLEARGEQNCLQSSEAGSYKGPDLKRIKLERLCWEEWKNIPKSRSAQLVSSHPRRLEAVIVARGASMKYWVQCLDTYSSVFFYCIEGRFISVFLYCNIILKYWKDLRTFWLCLEKAGSCSH